MISKLQIIKIFSIGIISLQIFGCNKPKYEEVVMPLSTGNWRGELHMQGQVLPFIFQVTYEKKDPIIHLINDKEQIKFDSVKITEDSIYIPMHVFETDIKAAFNDSTMRGEWTTNKDNYSIPFTATLGEKDRFKPSGDKAIADLSAKWEMFFIHEKKDTTKAIGLFEQQGHELSGIVRRKSDSYRHLAGIVSGDSIKLSTFDGNHAYLFTGKYEDDTLKGDFWSGKHWHEEFYAMKNEAAQLPEADTTDI